MESDRKSSDTMRRGRARPSRCKELDRCLSARLFKALSDPNRLLILAHLAGSGRSHTVSELARCCPVDVSVVSRHLGILRDAQILGARRRGKEVHYRIRTEHLVTALRSIANALERSLHAACARTADGKEERPRARGERRAP